MSPVTDDRMQMMTAVLEHVLAMADDAHFREHPEWECIVSEAKAAIANGPVEMTDAEYYDHKADNHEGEPTEDVYDARGIYVAEVCDKCRARAVRGYRLEIFEDPLYPIDEPIEPDEY